jgi:hypothetical protein
MQNVCQEDRCRLVIDCQKLKEVSALLFEQPLSAAVHNENPEESLAVLHFVADTYSQVLVWARNLPLDGEAIVYCVSEAGFLRSIFMANKISDLLISQGYETDILHNELAIRGLQ